MKKLLFSAFAVSAMMLQAQTWTTQNTNFPALSTGITAISIASPTTAWAFGYDGAAPPPGQVRGNYQQFTKTGDGGATWTSGAITLGNTTLLISDLAAVSTTTAFVCATPSAGGSGGGIWKTTNSGTSWTKQTTASYNFGSSFPNVVYFWDANNGFTMGDPNAGVFELYTTSNGGTNWTKVPSANIPPAPNDFGYVHLKAVAGNTIWFGTDIGRVFKSNDKGLTWTASQTPIVDFGGVTTPGSSGVLTLKDANTGWVMDQDASLYITTNAGLRFDPVATSGTVFADGIAFVPGTTNTLISTGVNSANFGSSISTDGGNTWTILEQDDQKTAIAAFDKNTVFAGGFTAAAGEGMFKLSALLATSENAAAKQGVSVYPNPTKGQVNLVTKSNISTVQVLDMSGKVVKNFSKITQLDLSGLQSGVYMLKVIMADGTSSVTKVVKN